MYFCKRITRPNVKEKRVRLSAKECTYESDFATEKNVSDRKPPFLGHNWYKMGLWRFTHKSCSKPIISLGKENVRRFSAFGLCNQFCSLKLTPNKQFMVEICLKSSFLIDSNTLRSHEKISSYIFSHPIINVSIFNQLFIV